MKKSGLKSPGRMAHAHQPGDERSRHVIESERIRAKADLLARDILKIHDNAKEGEFKEAKRFLKFAYYEMCGLATYQKPTKEEQDFILALVEGYKRSLQQLQSNPLNQEKDSQENDGTNVENIHQST